MRKLKNLSIYVSFICIARKVPQIFLLDVVGLAKKKFAFPLRSIIFCSFVVTFFLLPCRISHQGCGHNTKLMRMQLSRALKVRFFYMYPRMHLCPSMVLKFLSGLISIYKEPLRMLWFLWESIRRRQLDVPLLQDSFCSEVYSCVFFLNLTDICLLYLGKWSGEAMVHELYFLKHVMREMLQLFLFCVFSRKVNENMGIDSVRYRMRITWSGNGKS